MMANTQKARHEGWTRGKGEREKAFLVEGQHKPVFKEESRDLVISKAHVARRVISAHSGWIV